MKSSGKISKFEAESWSVSLVENGAGADNDYRQADDQPVPLDIQIPEGMTSDSKPPPRRSPRFVPAMPARNISSRKSNKGTVPGSEVRRSPRPSALAGPQSATVGPIVCVETECNTNTNHKNRKKDGIIVNDNNLRRSPRFSSASSDARKGKETLTPSVKVMQSQSSTSQLNDNKEAKVTNVESMKVKSLRRSPRLTSTPAESQGSSSEPTFKSSDNFSDLKTTTSGNLTDKLLCLSWSKDVDRGCVPLKPNGTNVSGEEQRRKSPRLTSKTENCGGNESLTKFEAHNLSFSTEKQLRRSPRNGLPTNSSRCDVSIGSLDVHEMGFCGEKLLGLSPSSMKATQGSDNDVSLTEGRREVQKEKPLETPFLCSTSLAGVDVAEVYSSSIRLSSEDSPPSKKFKVSSADSDMKMADEMFSKKINDSFFSRNKQRRDQSDAKFIGNPIPDDEAQERWRWRYEMKNVKSKRKDIPSDDDDENKIVWNVECHYAQAEVDAHVINLEDCVYVKGEAKDHIGRILEFFKTTDGENYFRVQWFYRVEDTVMQQETAFHDKRRLFYSTVMNDNPIDCIISKVSVARISPKFGLRSNTIPQSDFYFDMEYHVEYSTFRTFPTYNSFKSYSSSNCHNEIVPTPGTYKAEFALLDLYSGCGGMSTGLYLGAKASCTDIVTKWSVDSDKSACESLKLNHPETHVRNEAADYFLQLLKEWDKLCKRYAVGFVHRAYPSRSKTSHAAGDDANSPNDADVLPGEFEVSSLVDICYGDPSNKGKRGLHFKVRWKGYSASEDTWEPMEGLSNCQERIEEFVVKGFKSKILPLRGDVDVICGGPPCQGISGYNRFRNVDSPLDDERNRQIVVFMDIVDYLKPKFVLMENVVDILRFDKASLGRYALSRLVHMKYQARLGIMAAGCYGLPQFRLRVFLWGAQPNEKLPQFPLPTHDVIIRYWPPPEFERNTVAYDEDQPRELCELEEALVLRDAISDLPAVANDEDREEMPYKKPPETEFQRYIRSSKYEMTGSALNGAARIRNQLYDHRPLPLFEDDYTRVCLIPKRKGANFRDLPGVIVGKNNVARREPTHEKKLLPSGKPLVPDYCFTFEQGKSRRPFARLWWDETVPTVVTYPNCHSQAALHPEQDRLLTIREYARLQGFPDYYRFRGTLKERYCQIGNAVAVPVSRALGYALGMAIQKRSGDEPLMALPPKFSLSTNIQLAKSLPEKT